MKKFLKINLFLIIIFIVGIILSLSLNKYPSRVIENPEFDVTTIQNQSMYEVDGNKDGFNESILYYDDKEQLVSSKYDSNGDKKYDFQVIYKDGKDLYQYLDTNADGGYDEIVKVGANNTYDYLYPNSIKSHNSIGSININKIMIVIFLVLIIVYVACNLASKGLKKTTAMILVFCFWYNAFSIIIYAKDDMYNKDGNINNAYFEENWTKYSDVGDDRIPLESKTYNAQQIDKLTKNIEEKIAEIKLLEFDYGVITKYIEEITKENQVLKKGMKKNLIKSMMRLSVLTGVTIKKGYDLKSGFLSIYDTTASTLKRGVDFLKFVKEFAVPSAEEKKKEILKTDKEKKQDKIHDYIAGSNKDGYDLLTSIEGNTPDELATNFVAETTKFAIKKVAEKMEVPKIELSDEELIIIRDENKLLQKLDNHTLMTINDQAHLRSEMEKLYTELDLLFANLEELYKYEKEDVKQKLIDAKKREMEEDEDGKNDEEIEGYEHEGKEEEEVSTGKKKNTDVLEFDMLWNDMFELDEFYSIRTKWSEESYEIGDGGAREIKYYKSYTLLIEDEPSINVELYYADDPKVSEKYFEKLVNEIKSDAKIIGYTEPKVTEEPKPNAAGFTPMKLSRRLTREPETFLDLGEYQSGFIKDEPNKNLVYFNYPELIGRWYPGGDGGVAPLTSSHSIMTPDRENQARKGLGFASDENVVENMIKDGDIGVDELGEFKYGVSYTYVGGSCEMHRLFRYSPNIFLRLNLKDSTEVRLGESNQFNADNQATSKATLESLIIELIKSVNEDMDSISSQIIKNIDRYKIDLDKLEDRDK